MTFQTDTEKNEALNQCEGRIREIIAARKRFVEQLLFEILCKEINQEIDDSGLREIVDGFDE